MEMLAPVDLDIATMRRVVEHEGGCIVWGGTAHLSPADDALIRVERPLDLDSAGQLVASVLSKKAAAGATGRADCLCRSARSASCARRVHCASHQGRQSFLLTAVEGTLRHDQ